MKEELELTDEEIQMIKNHRLAADAAKEAARVAAEQEKSKKTLEQRFLQAVEVAHTKIESEIKQAAEALKRAEVISEEYGIPFSSVIVNMGYRERSFTPKSFLQKWNTVDKDFVYDTLDDAGIRASLRDTGWEDWNTSSLSC